MQLLKNYDMPEVETGCTSAVQKDRKSVLLLLTVTSARLLSSNKRSFS